MFVVAPKPPQGNDPRRRAPRGRHLKTHYVYTEDSGDSIKDIVLSIVNGIGMENVDPALFPQLVFPLNQEIPRLERYRNYSAIKQVYLALDFIQKYYEPPIQLEEAKQPSKQEIFYSAHQISKLVKSAMNGKKLPVMPPKMKKMVMQELNKIAINKGNDPEGRQAEHALYQLATPKKRLLEPIEKNVAENMTVEDQIEKIKANLHKQLSKNEAEKNAELSKLKLTRDAQLNLVNQYIAANPPKEPKKYNAEIADLKAEEQYFLSINKFAQAEKARTKIMRIQEAEKRASEESWKQEIEKQINLIEKNYSEKHRMKLKCFKGRAKHLRAQATKQINNLLDMQSLHQKPKVQAAKSLPKLNPKKPSEIPLVRSQYF